MPYYIHSCILCVYTFHEEHVPCLSALRPCSLSYPQSKVSTQEHGIMQARPLYPTRVEFRV